MNVDRIRQIVIGIAGTSCLVYAVWPPLEPEYIAIAGTLLGIEPLAGGYRKAKTRNDAQ